jgi:hypothetical protein
VRLNQHGINGIRILLKLHEHKGTKHARELWSTKTSPRLETISKQESYNTKCTAALAHNISNRRSSRVARHKSQNEAERTLAVHVERGQQQRRTPRHDEREAEDSGAIALSASESDES